MRRIAACLLMCVAIFAWLLVGCEQRSRNVVFVDDGAPAVVIELSCGLPDFRVVSCDEKMTTLRCTSSAVLTRGSLPVTAVVVFQLFENANFQGLIVQENSDHVQVLPGETKPVVKDVRLPTNAAAKVRAIRADAKIVK